MQWCKEDNSTTKTSRTSSRRFSESWRRQGDELPNLKQLHKSYVVRTQAAEQGPELEQGEYPQPFGPAQDDFQDQGKLEHKLEIREEASQMVYVLIVASQDTKLQIVGALKFAEHVAEKVILPLSAKLRRMEPQRSLHEEGLSRSGLKPQEANIGVDTNNKPALPYFILDCKNLRIEKCWDLFCHVSFVHARKWNHFSFLFFDGPLLTEWIQAWKLDRILPVLVENGYDLAAVVYDLSSEDPVHYAQPYWLVIWPSSKRPNNHWKTKLAAQSRQPPARAQTTIPHQHLQHCQQFGPEGAWIVMNSLLQGSNTTEKSAQMPDATMF